MLLDIQNVTKNYGDKTVLSNVCFSVNEGERIGLVGINGCGKSTLLNIICKDLFFESGTVSKANNLRIGFLEQNTGLDRDGTIFAAMLSVYDNVLAIADKLREIEKKMSESTDHQSESYKQMSAEYSRLSEHFEKSDGYNIEVNIKKILGGMGFADKDYQMQVRNLSGGEKTRLALARLLLENPQLLVLDEPTNHLDFKTLMWLEDYLQSYKGAVVIVSHDRYFLDRIVTKIWEIEQTKSYIYKGNYSKYKILKKERIEFQQKEYEKQQKQIASMLDYAQKNIARASTSNSAKSRLHQLENMEIIEKPFEQTKTAKLEFNFEKESVKDVLTVSGLELAVGEQEGRVTLASDISFEIKRGDKLAIIGANGTGKSTMLKALVGKAPQEKGRIEWGKNTKLSYYDQENDNLDFNKTAIDELWHRFPRLTQSQVRTQLGRVMLTGENVFKKVSVLSGGERAKLALALMSMENANTLVLDEPTNHLDLDTKEVLEEALCEFSGTVVLVSHDRYFLNRIPNKIIEITPSGVTLYNGNFDYYLEKSALERASQVDEPQKREQTEKKASTYRSKEQRKADVKRKNEIASLEKQIEQCEAKIDEINLELMGEKASDYEFMTQKCQELEQTKQLLDECMARWVELA
ncbi:MAG: ABC-F family ATP-binding cassette domain-containing protein [Oscillospiraceae bacterium]|nr:ABC-F family ATP-binding cassette domain-containing protein [Oscillospiraceae bacterium]